MIDPTSLRFSTLLPDPATIKLLSDQGIESPTPVQQAVIPPALQGLDLVAQAQTGSGKTLAFVLPMAVRLKEENGPKNQTRALIVTPTRELATQVARVVNSVMPGVEVPCIIGGMSIGSQKRAIEADARIVVGTPGRITDLMNQGILSLKRCCYVVLDEADEMLSLGFIEEVTDILKRLPKERQGLFLSATISPRITMLANQYLQSPKTIVVESDSGSAPEIEHLYVSVGPELTAKVKALAAILDTRAPRSCIVFCNTKSDTEFVEVYLKRRGYDALRLNSDLAQKDRNRVMDLLRDDKLKVLIATDIAARGIDISQIDLVIQYSLHDQPETYVHRSGRTGRAGRHGCAISLIGPVDGSNFHLLKKAVDFEIREYVPESPAATQPER